MLPWVHPKTYTDMYNGPGSSETDTAIWYSYLPNPMSLAVNYSQLYSNLCFTGLMFTDGPIPYKVFSVLFYLL